MQTIANTYAKYKCPLKHAHLYTILYNRYLPRIQLAAAQSVGSLNGRPTSSTSLSPTLQTADITTKNTWPISVLCLLLLYALCIWEVSYYMYLQDSSTSEADTDKTWKLKNNIAFQSAGIWTIFGVAPQNCQLNFHFSPSPFLSPTILALCSPPFSQNDLDN